MIFNTLFAALYSVIIVQSATINPPVFDESVIIKNYPILNETFIPIKVLQIPQDIKDTIAPPVWVEDWEELEFAAPSDMFSSVPIYGDNDNLTIKAAAYAFAHGSGVWILQDHTERNELTIDKTVTLEDVLEFYQIGELGEIGKGKKAAA
ncbi:hypothetical protein KGF54_000007 [Candida jiufengensis]|uniref:uncharacterized protein n=1 Tax=Candida jiufengensis TaxID=497108 RepID=UPI0022249B30|nr:uncharacterized protein KGF54_000007 [Candida jiufengensis]KAI5957079.1 hypothetical protein KGF54_000007 [Candida jiufengensis]